MSCSVKVRTDTQGRLERNFSISDDKSQRVFTVTIKKQSRKDTYWCAVEIDGGRDIKEDFEVSFPRGKSFKMQNIFETPYIYQLLGYSSCVVLKVLKVYHASMWIIRRLQGLMEKR